MAESTVRRITNEILGVKGLTVFASRKCWFGEEKQGS